MKTLIALLTVAFIATAAFAQSGAANRVKQRATRVRNQSQSARGAPAPSTAKPAPTPPPDPVLTATRQNIASLEKDLAGLKSDAAQKRQLRNDLRAAALGTKPSEASVSRLADDLTAAAAGKGFPVQQAKLAQDLHAIFNSSHLSAAQQQAIFESVPKILESNGASAELAAQVRKDLERIAAETK